MDIRWKIKRWTTQTKLEEDGGKRRKTTAFNLVPGCREITDRTRLTVLLSALSASAYGED